MWIRPNVRGVLLLLAVVVIGLSIIPTPTISYCLDTGEEMTSGSWWYMSAIITLILVAYPFCMRISSRRPPQGVVRLLTGPLLIIPQGLVVAAAVGMYVYEPPEIHGDLERHLFLQGNTDWGGGCLFAGTMALYVAFGFTAAWYLTLALSDLPRIDGFWVRWRKAVWILKFHLLAFLIGGTANLGYDARVTPNDFRNMFLFAAFLYLLSVCFITALSRTRFRLRIKLLLAPLFTVLWLIVGSDGNTQRAGQRVQSGQDPQPIVRSERHRIMMSWHALCDHVFGDIRPPP